MGVQVAYYGLLQLFLSRKALFLSVWDSSADEHDPESMGVQPCLRSLSLRVSGNADVILVGNKYDQGDHALGPRAAVAKAVESDCREWLAKFRWAGGHHVVLEEEVSLYISANHGWWRYILTTARRGLAWLSLVDEVWPCDRQQDAGTSLLDRLDYRHWDKEYFRAEKMVLPSSWSLALSFVALLRDGTRWVGRYRHLVLYI